MPTVRSKWGAVHVLSESASGSGSSKTGASKGGSGAAAGAPDPYEKAAKDAKRMSSKQLEKAAKENGYKDAHALKEDYGLNSKSDIFVDKDGNLYAGPRQGTGTPQRLGIRIDGT